MDGATIGVGTGIGARVGAAEAEGGRLGCLGRIWKWNKGCSGGVGTRTGRPNAWPIVRVWYIRCFISKGGEYNSFVHS